MATDCKRLVEAIHAAPWRTVLALSGGGSRALSELLAVPGASRTLLDAAIPYSGEALIEWLGGRPDQFCAAETARAMAMVAFRRARRLAGSEAGHLAGIACTAGLATDRPRKGEHRAHVVVQTDTETACWSLHLAKGRRSRREEEQVVATLLLNCLAELCQAGTRLPLPLTDEEPIEEVHTTAQPAWRELLLGQRDVARENGAAETPVVVLSGAFRPLHAGHRRMAEVAGQLIGGPVHFEMPIVNPDKAPLDYYEIESRLAQFTADQPVLLSRAATFVEKSALFYGTTFAVGIDTLRRIASPAYYGGDPAARLNALERIAERGCRFLVFGRDMGTGFVRLGDVDLPDCLRAICREVPPEAFREDISSTALRREERKTTDY